MSQTFSVVSKTGELWDINGSFPLVDVPPVPAVVAVRVGDPVSGVGVPAGATVASVDKDKLTTTPPFTLTSGSTTTLTVG